MSNQTFKRGQAEWALWRAFTFMRSGGEDPPQIFKTRIKRLFDLDRDSASTAGLAAAPHAFMEVPGGGSGVETQYTAFDVFSLGIALDLLDVGFKQSEIVFVMRFVRPILAERFPTLLARPSLIDRQNVLAKLHPDLPVIERPGKAPLADARVFLVLNRIEITEVLSAPPAGARDEAVFLSPEFIDGIGALKDRLGVLMPLHRRTVIVVEITALAQAIDMFLEKAPTVSRGRPRQR